MNELKELDIKVKTDQDKKIVVKNDVCDAQDIVIEVLNEDKPKVS